ncbi:MAG: DUF86 domain-containing protein, partial [Phycisphaerales bacterium]|nr:DUF86 domain-containing protein [Phycisphaerales bacterium]
MSFGPPELIRHILDEIDFVIDRSAGLDECAFMRDPTVQRAFIRSLEIIGEAVKKLPPDFRAAHGDIPWKRMAGLRDRLIHDY